MIEISLALPKILFPFEESYSMVHSDAPTLSQTSKNLVVVELAAIGQDFLPRKDDQHGSHDRSTSIGPQSDDHSRSVN